MSIARYAILAQFILVTLAATALIYGLVTTDFSIKYVAFNTTRATPIYYRVTGLWGALEGSLLLWEWILIIFSGVVAWLYRDRHKEMMPWVLMIFCIVSAFFLGVVGFLSNPFEIISPVPLDGRGLNPLLEDANMMTHPPLLYTGFVGLTVPYAFAMAALIVGKLDEAWIVTHAALDDYRLVFSHRGQSGRRLVVLSCARLGRLLGLGSGGKRRVHALAAGHGFFAFDSSAGAPAHAESVEPVADHHRLQPDHLRHLSHPLGNSVVDSCVFIGTGGRLFSWLS